LEKLGKVHASDCYHRRRIPYSRHPDKYAIQAFRFSAVDYLLKPVNPEQLKEAVLRAGKLIQEHFDKQMKVLEDNLKSISNKNKKIILRTTESIHLLDVGNIICCDSDSSYTTVHTVEGEKIIVSRTLKDFEEMLGLLERMAE